VTVDRSTLRLIDRGDLLAALDRAVAGKVTIISALQVRDRSSAVQRARELRLLAAGRTR
jgi:hypothetical protein